jgi:hypothetical protein
MAFRRFCHAILGGEPIAVFGDGTQTRDSTFGGGSRVSVAQTLATLAAIAGRRPGGRPERGVRLGARARQGGPRDRVVALGG